MALSAGDKLGPYEILSPIGAGGMGEVYKARDSRLDRLVAIKVLPEHIARREDLCARFEREAHTVASLNHPHVCALYDIGNQDGTRYMVLELLEGETLAARIEKGALPLKQALALAAQIADALDRAHRAGVTHRDVKPQNIVLTRDGVKVLDFGLAKSTHKPGPTESTLTAALTTEGTVMGTPQYMAPEQFEGREADARSDIWAFGAVLYEMVTGQRAFQGKSYSSLVGAILSADPPPMPVKPFTPAWLERLVGRCLAKDPEDRWQSMRDVVLELRSPVVESAAAGKPNRWRWAAAVLGLALVAVAAIQFRRTPPEQPVLTTSILPPEGASFDETAISPDGKLLAFTATSERKRQLWVRPLRASAAQPLAGTEGAEQPFWSPDSRRIGFFVQGKLKKIEAAGGPGQTLCDVPNPRGGTWSSEGVIVYAVLSGGLWSVAAQGGAPMRITTIDETAGVRHRWPVFLIGGHHYLYLIPRGNTSGIYLGSLGSKQRTRLVGDASAPGYAEGPEKEGYLLFVREGTLMAQRLDAAKAALSGEAFPVAERVGFDPVSGGGAFSVSGNGMLVYESDSRGLTQMTWMERGGKRLETIGEARRGYFFPSLSPDERVLAFTFLGGPGQMADIWLRDLERGISTRFTFHPQLDMGSIWSPDGSRIAFASSRAGPSDLYVKSASGAGQEELLLKSGNQKYASDWSPDGRLLLYYEDDPQTRYDLWVLPMDGERKPTVFLRTEFSERAGKFSPDGKWLAYTSDESGQYGIYVQPYPPTGAKWQLSRAGGRWPKWRRDGKELYWRQDDGKMMVAEVEARTAFRPGIPQALFETGIRDSTESYAVSGDGRRFLVPLPVVKEAGDRPVTVVQNWLAAAKR